MSFGKPTAAITGAHIDGIDQNLRATGLGARPMDAAGRTSAVSDPPGTGRNAADGKGNNPLSRVTAQKLRPQELAMDAVGIIGVDSARRGRFVFDAAEAAGYLTSSALYQMFGYQLVEELTKGTIGDAQVEYSLGKVAWNAAMLGVTGRIFGTRTTIPEAFLTSLGAETISYGVGEVAFGGGAYVGPLSP